MSAEQAVELLAELDAAGVRACVGGGWAVDALLGEQSRTHGDLDLWVTAPDLDPLIRSFADRGLDRLLPWGGDRPWNHVLHDGGQLRVDLHLDEPRGDGAWQCGSPLAGHAFPRPGAAGCGHDRRPPGPLRHTGLVGPLAHGSSTARGRPARRGRPVLRFDLALTPGF